MTHNKPAFPWKLLMGIGVLVVVGLVTGIAYWSTGRSTPAARADEAGSKVKSIPVRFIHPKKGLLKRLSTQPGSVQAYESVRLFAKVPGFLKKQNVDIGDRVKKGNELAVVDVPELEAQVLRNSAAVDQAKAKVRQMKARVNSAKADLDAAKSGVVQAEATAKSAASWVRYRTLQHKRLKELFASRSIEEKLVDESKERFEASVETELSAQAAVVTSKAKVVASDAKIDGAQADVVVAESEVRVAQAELTKAEVQVAFATITAPFDGVVVHRSSVPGDFVRSANEGGSHEPLLTIHRTDVMRVIVYVPDRDVPFTDPGDAALVEIDALTGKKFPAKVSRVSRSEDTQTRSMRVEIDLPNPTGRICHGMYGKATIVLDKNADQFSIPSACLAGKAENGVGEVYVIRDTRAHLVKVQLGIDNGLRVAVVEGLRADDRVIHQPGSELSNGVAVTPTESKDE